MSISPRTGSVEGRTGRMGDYRLVNSTLARLQARQDLHAVARVVLDGIRKTKGLPPVEDLPLVGEGDSTKNFCFSPGGTNLFVCSTDFSCSDPGNHDCPADDLTYADCGASAGTYNCESDFSCDVDYFDCSTFSCAQSGGSFGCESNVDFLCNGEEFSCSQSNECSADHIFICSESFECTYSFTCSGGVGADNDCNTPPLNYSVPPPEDSDPGDFFCGYPEGTTGETFECAKSFTCAAEDDFSCVTGTTFTCLDEAEPPNEFECEASFECRSTFDCISIEVVDCDGEGGSYDCTGGATYNQDPS